MTKYPFWNATAALLYIVFIVSFIRLIGFVAGDKPDNDFLAPIGALSLLVLSASVMAFIFFYTPLLLLLAGKHQQATTLFLKTIALFALFAITIFFVILFLIP